jgi:hypothetical protein
LNDLLGGGVDYDAAKANVQAHYSDDAINFVDQIIDACPAEMKAVLLTLVTCFAAVDETVSVDENRFILKLMA